MTERVKIKCDDCKFVEDCVDYGWDGCRKFTPKCPLCDGKGKYKNGLGVVSRCYYCLGTGEVNDKCERVKTEQEYIQTCNTEQLAEIVLHLAWDTNEIYQMILNDIERSKESKLKIVNAWLKQPHGKE